MSSGIFIIQDGDNLIELIEKDYDSETILQGLMARHPSLLAGKQMGLTTCCSRPMGD